jgi:hypothetical protein
MTTSTTSKCASVWVGAVALFAAASAASAQQSRPYGGELYQAPQMSSVNNPYSDYPAAEVQSVPAAKARAAIARMELLRAHVNLNRDTRAAVRGFEKSDEVSTATAEQAAAYERYQAARERALRPLADDKDYRAAQEMKSRIGEQIAAKHDENARKSPFATPTGAAAPLDKPVLHEILALATIKMRYSMAATNREAELLRQSDEVRDARAQLVSASGRVSNLRARFADDLREDPDLIAARRAVFDQRVAYVASRAYLSGLIEARGIALDYAYFARRYNPYRVAPYDPYGFGRTYYSYGNGYNY